MKSGIKVVKREEREARNNLLVTDELAASRSTPESIVKSWITSARERRVTQAANGLREFRSWDENRIADLAHTAAALAVVIILVSFGCS